MIAFGCGVTEPALYERRAEPGIRLAAEPDSLVLPEGVIGSIARVYNLILREAAPCEDLEALVLIHEEAEIVDPDLCRKLRRVFSDPDVAVVGCAGALDVRSIAWWEGTAPRASSVYRSEELGGEFPALLSDGWDGEELSTATLAGEVDVVDGVMMVLSPWAVRNLRFDESLGPRHGYDFDFCLQARAAGRKVVTEELRLAHYYPLAVVGDPETWTEAHMRVAEKWDGRIPGGHSVETDWKLRARQAEGKAAAARLLSATKMYEVQALEREHERGYKQATDKLSWRITAPLRQLNALRKKAWRRRPDSAVADRSARGGVTR